MIGADFSPKTKQKKKRHIPDSYGRQERRYFTSAHLLTAAQLLFSPSVFSSQERNANPVYHVQRNTSENQYYPTRCSA